MSGGDRLCVTAMWETAGCPPPDFVPRKRGETPKAAKLPERFDGVCAVTGASGPVWAAAGVVSDNFGDWDRCPYRHCLPTGFSDPVAWAFRNPAFVWQAHVLDPTGLRQVGPPDLYATLSGPIGADRAVILPISGKKHVAPFAVWGAVNTDNDTVTWRGSDVVRLATVARLRALGFGEQERRVGLVVDGNALQYGRGVWLRRGWPDLWQQLVTTLPRLKEMS
jgi:hypothetical protein